MSNTISQQPKPIQGTNLANIGAPASAAASANPLAGHTAEIGENRVSLLSRMAAAVSSALSDLAEALLPSADTLDRFTSRLAEIGGKALSRMTGNLVGKNYSEKNITDLLDEVAGGATIPDTQMTRDLRAHCMREFNVENLDFATAASTLRAVHGAASGTLPPVQQREMRAALREIGGSFVAVGSEKEINVQGDDRQSFMDALKLLDTEAPDGSIPHLASTMMALDPLIRQCANMLRQDVTPRFINAINNGKA